MEFNDFTMKTSRLKDILNTLCKDMLKYVMFIDDEKKSKLILATKRNHCACVPCYWGELQHCLKAIVILIIIDILNYLSTLARTLNSSLNH